MKIAKVLGLLVLSTAAHAEDFPPSTDESASGNSGSAANSSSGSAASSDSSEFEKGFGGAQGISEGEKLSAEVDRLKIGGTLSTDLYLFGTDGTSNRDYLFNPNSISVYLDSTLRNDIRALARGRLVWESSGAAATQAIPASSTEIEELKLFFNAKKKVFFTVGKQKIKWGSGKFWNPTDVLNNTRRDLLFSDDRRSGRTLLKTHIPWGNSNLYLVQSFDDATRSNEVGNAARAEIPLLSAEFALTASKQAHQKAVFGADVSAGILDFDIHAEFAYSHGSNSLHYASTGLVNRSRRNTFNWVAGGTFEGNYGDGDTWGVTLEYFHNGDGYAKADYRWPLTASSYTPFYFSEHYAMLMFYLPNPGSWNKTTISLFHIYDITDRSALAKLNVGFVLMQDLNLDLGTSLRYGKSDGELRFANARYDVSAGLKVSF